jgi:hypothetical protein
LSFTSTILPARSIQQLSSVTCLGFSSSWISNMLGQCVGGVQ